MNLDQTHDLLDQELEVFIALVKINYFTVRVIKV